MEKDRPQTQQRSRKGKKAWRKNVDISEVQEGLEINRENKRIYGEDHDQTADFIIDEQGDEAIFSKNPTRKLKSTEILEKSSKIPALNVERNNKKIQGVHKKDVHRLMKLSGRVHGTSVAAARVEKDGLTNVKNGISDVWGISEPEVPELLKKSTSGHTKATVVPGTLKEAPIAIDNMIKDIASGKSYNPSFESWKELLNLEFDKEMVNEKRRQQIKDHQEKIQHLVKTLKDIEVEEESSEDEAEAEEENKEESDNEGDVKSMSLSINKPTVNKKKTKAQRNKQRRNKEREELQETLHALKKQIHELNKLDTYQEEVLEKEKNRTTKTQRAPKKHFKFDSVPEQLEIKLSDELSDSLRKLKPEGNLLYDHMRDLQKSGKIEARIPVAKKRKYAPKITEKWTYKDFK